MDLKLDDICSEIDLREKYRSKGGFKAAVADAKKSLGIDHLSFRSWVGLYALMKNNAKGLQPPASTEDGFFVSETARVIFALTMLDGQARAGMLKITPEHYSNLAKAKNWWRKNISLLHPDRCHHPLAKDATAKLNEMFEKMTQYGK